MELLQWNRIPRKRKDKPNMGTNTKKERTWAKISRENRRKRKIQRNNKKRRRGIPRVNDKGVKRYSRA